MRKQQEVAYKLLRESGFNVEEFPDYLKANPTLIEHAKHLPHDMRAEYLSRLLRFSRIYEQLDARGRAQVLRQFRKQLREDYARKLQNH